MDASWFPTTAELDDHAHRRRQWMHVSMAWHASRHVDTRTFVADMRAALEALGEEPKADPVSVIAELD
jgi:hypothetical protein